MVLNALYSFLVFKLVVLDISACKIVSVATHLDAMGENDGVSRASAPFLLQFAVEHTGAHWI